MATIQEVKDLLTAQASKDPRQTLHRVKALVFGEAPAPAPAPTPPAPEPVGTD
jgi:hypothetical protein